jgi:hypothetical protein
MSTHVGGNFDDTVTRNMKGAQVQKLLNQAEINIKKSIYQIQMVFEGHHVDELNANVSTKVTLVKDVPFLATINCYGQFDPLQLNIRYLDPGTGLHINGQFKS